jgi:hypothetical protein
MKLLALLFSFLATQTLSALPLMNPWDASLYTNGIFSKPVDKCKPWYLQFRARAGFYEDYVRDRKLKVDETHRKKVVHQTLLRTDAAFIALNHSELFDLFATLGRTRIEVIATRSVWAISPESNQFTFLPEDPAFVWSVGGRLSLLEYRCLCLGIEGQYFTTNPNINSFRVEGMTIEVPKGHFNYKEWQVGLGAAYKMQVFCPTSSVVPYVGLKWSDVRTTTHHLNDLPSGADEFFDLKNQRHFGYAVGFSFVWKALASVTLEARFLDERAYHLNAQIAF